MRSERRRFGDRGEALAETYLRAKGFLILGRQLHAGRLGEIDLLARDRGEIVFVEVKARRDRRYGPPEEAVTAAKLARLRAAAEAILLARGWSDRPHRLDAVAVDLTGSAPEIRHLVRLG